MANDTFLRIDKGLFGLGLSPIEILVYSQIEEFNRTTGDCFISNATMAKNFSVSEKTVARALDALEDRGLIVRHTKNTQKGKERHIALAKDKMSFANETLESAKDKMSLAERTNCPLRNGQNDSIKDNLKEKEKENIGVDKTASLRSAVVINSQDGLGGVNNPIEVEKEWLREQYRNAPNDWITNSASKTVLHKPTGKYYKRKDA